MKNKEKLFLIDWEKDIVEEGINSLNCVEKALDYAEYCNDVKNALLPNITGKIDNLHKYKCLKTIQYFYGKFNYYYQNMSDSTDLEFCYPIEDFELDENFIVDSDNLDYIEKVLDVFKEEKAENNILEYVKAEKLFSEFFDMKHADVFISSDRDYIYLKNELKYRIEIMKNSDDDIRRKNTKEAARLHEIIIEKYHDIAKKIVSFYNSKGFEDVYVMEGGGSQFQLFFGDKDGYLSILYLDLKDGTENDYTLVPERLGDMYSDFYVKNILFENVFNV